MGGASNEIGGGNCVNGSDRFGRLRSGKWAKQSDGQHGQDAQSGQDGQDQQNSVSETPLQVTAPELSAAYKRNEIAARRTYAGHLLRISGIVRRASSDFADNPQLLLVGISEFDEVTLEFGKEHTDALSRLSPGEMFSADCQKITSFMGDPMASECYPTPATTKSNTGDTTDNSTDGQKGSQQTGNGSNEVQASAEPTPAVTTDDDPEGSNQSDRDSENGNCKATVLARVVADEDHSAAMEPGETFDHITQYRVDVRRAGGLFCQHGGYCYPRYVIQYGRPVEAIHLINCAIGKQLPPLSEKDREVTYELSPITVTDSAPRRTPKAIVEAFYRALSAGDGQAASQLVVPEKRASGSFSADSINRFYRSLDSGLKLESVIPQSADQFRVFYTYSYRSGLACDGVAIVTTTETAGEALERFMSE